MGQRPDGEAQQSAERRVFEVTLKDGTVYVNDLICRSPVGLTRPC